MVHLGPYALLLFCLHGMEDFGKQIYGACPENKINKAVLGQELFPFLLPYTAGHADLEVGFKVF